MSSLRFNYKNIINLKQINSKFIAIAQSYSIPTTLSSPNTNSNSSFLLLNTEFNNQTNLFGFTLYAAVNGSINIMVLF